MFPNRPYLIRAIYEWILDNHFTPHVLVDAKISGVIVPKEHIENGQGMVFDPSEYDGVEGGGDAGKTIEPPRVSNRKPRLKLVKK